MGRVIRPILLSVLAVILAVLFWLGYEAHAVYTYIGATYHPAPRIAAEPRATPVADFLGNHRINILLLGSDNDQKFRQKYPLTQSMIVVSIDPVHHKVVLLSIPRDFWVPIPGFGMGKIDAAAEQGGVPLARATVETLFNITIDYYAWVGLNGFSHLVDDVGGVTIDITHPILDDFYPNDQSSANPYAYMRLFIPPGWRHLSGRQALEYVRSRHADAGGDFGRAARQQQVLLQLQKTASAWNLVLKIPQLAHDLGGMLQTDVPPARLLDIARLAHRLHASDITRVVLSCPTYCQNSTAADGQSILIPDWQTILPVTTKLFAPIGTASPSSPQQTPTPAQETVPTVPARVSVVMMNIPLPTATPTATPQPPPTPAPISLDRLPGKLIYASGGTLYQIGRHGRVTDIMPSWMTAADMPAVSSNGHTLAFIRWSPNASDVDITDLRTHQIPSPITNDASADSTTVSNSLWAAWPSWSADGKTLLFSADRYKLQAPAGEGRMLDLAVYAMNPDGSNPRQLTAPAAGAGGDTDPQFRGTTSEYLYDHWAYQTQDGATSGQPYSQLVIRDLNNPAALWTLTPPSGQIVQPALDRTGNLLAYVQTDGSSSRLISARIVDTASGPQLQNQQVLASGELAQPAFTPDGHWISYLRAEGNGFAIYLVPATGGPSVKLKQAGDNVDAISRPVWTP